MNKETVYKLDSKGKTRQWSIWVDELPDNKFSVIKIETGLVEGKKVTQQVLISEGKNLGKVNETTPYTQAVSEAQAKLEQQLRSGYVKDINEVKESGTLGSGIKAPMLAQKFDSTLKQKGSKDLKKLKLEGKKIHVQPKLDGNRCLIHIERVGDSQISAGMYTRKGDLMPVQLVHITQPLVDAYLAVTQDNPDAEPIVLDGELFSTEMPFNELNGHLKRKDSQDAEQLAKIKYHLYDTMLDANYEKRYAFIKALTKNLDEDVTSVELIPSYEIIATNKNIEEKLVQFLEEKHEGLMIRTLDTPYEYKRSWQLLKVKNFEDFETKIVDLEEDSMGRLGFFIMEMPEPVQDRDGKWVTTFKAGLSGVSHEEGAKMLKEKSNYVGKMATIEHFGWDIRPRFPKFKGVREDA